MFIVIILCRINGIGDERTLLHGSTVVKNLCDINLLRAGVHWIHAPRFRTAALKWESHLPFRSDSAILQMVADVESIFIFTQTGYKRDSTKIMRLLFVRIFWIMLAHRYDVGIQIHTKQSNGKPDAYRSNKTVIVPTIFREKKRNAQGGKANAGKESNVFLSRRIVLIENWITRLSIGALSNVTELTHSQ